MRTFLQEYPPNTLGKDYVVGDIHGCYYALERLLRHVGFHHATDRVFSVGDLVDRGPQSLEVLSLLKRSWFFSCLGNHEESLTQHLQNPFDVPPVDPKWLLKECRSITERQVFAGRFLNTLKNLPLVIRVGEPKSAESFFVAHAEILDSRKSVSEKMIADNIFSSPEKTHKRIVWGRSLYAAYTAGREVKRAHTPDLPFIFCGHTITSSPLLLARQVYLDGGAYTAYDGNKDARLRLFDVKEKTCFSCDPISGSVEKTSIVKPITL